MIKLSRFLKNFSNERNFSSFFYFILHNLSLFFFTTKYLEQNSTIPVNLKNRFKEFQLNTSILRINLLFNLLDSPYDSSCNGNGFKKKKKFFIFPSPPGSEPMPITRNEQLPRVHTCSLTNESEGRGRRERRRERIDRYSITRSRAVETRGGGRREFKPL